MLLDSYAWIEFFIGSNKGETVRDIVNSKECFTSIFSIAEIVEWSLKRSLNYQKYIKTIQKNSSVVEFNEEIMTLVGKINFEKKKKIKNWGMADSIILAVSKFYNLQIVTGDKHFKNLENTLFLG